MYNYLRAAKQIRKFIQSESGAISVDWVVLTATIVGLGLAVSVAALSTIGRNAEIIGEKVSESPTAVPAITNTDGQNS